MTLVLNWDCLYEVVKTDCRQTAGSLQKHPLVQSPSNTSLQAFVTSGVSAACITYSTEQPAASCQNLLHCTVYSLAATEVTFGNNVDIIQESSQSPQKSLCFGLSLKSLSVLISNLYNGKKYTTFSPDFHSILFRLYVFLGMYIHQIYHLVY